MAWSGPARSFKLRSVHLEFAEEQSFCALWRVLDVLRPDAIKAAFVLPLGGLDLIKDRRDLILVRDSSLVVLQQMYKI